MHPLTEFIEQISIEGLESLGKYYSMYDAVVVSNADPKGHGRLWITIPSLAMDNVIVTPHTASYCDTSFERLKRCVGQETGRVLSGYWPRNLVNKGVKPKVKLINEY